MDITKLHLSSGNFCQIWDDFTSNFEHGHHNYTSFIKGATQTFGHSNESLMCLDNGQVIGVLPLVHIKSKIFGDSLTSLPFYNYGGMLSSNNQATELLIDAAKRLANELNVKKLQIRQCEETIALSNNGAQLETHKVNMHLVFPEDFALIGAGNGKKRSKLRSQATLSERKSEELGFTLVHKFGHLEMVDDFYYVFSRHMKFLGTPVYAKKFFSDLLETFKTDAKLIVSYIDGVPAACGFMLSHRDSMSIPWASCLVEHNHISLNANMYYHILRTAHIAGYKKFDFGRSTMGANTYKFKSQWGAEPQQCYWYTFCNNKVETLESPKDGKFGLAVKVWKKLPLFVANTFGPHIVKQIP